MNLKKCALIVPAIVMTISVASAAEVNWPKNSASDLSIFVTQLRFRIYADHCSVNVPQLQPKFESLVEHLNIRVQDISRSLLASDLFKGMKDKPVPDRITVAFKDSFDDLKHNFERKDAASVCPETLQKMGELNDESLKSDLLDSLTAVRNMIRNLEKDGVHRASPEEKSIRNP